MKKLLILGAGQYGIVARDIAESINKYDVIEFLDDKSERAVGKLEDIFHLEYDEAFVAIGDPAVREYWLNNISSPATLIHPAATVMPSAEIGEGSVIEAGAVISSGSQIGKGCIVMANVVVGHNAKIGELCQLRYNCTIDERAFVPSKTKVACNVFFESTEAVAIK